MGKSIICLLLSSIICCIVLSQEKKIDKHLLIKDIEVLKTNLETYHTGLYTYTSKEKFNKWYLETKMEMEDMSSLDFFKKLNELNQFIQNGHTFFHINPEQRGKDLLMPSFKIYKDHKLFYIKSIKGSKDSEIIGKQVISINKIPIAEVFKNLLKYEKRDGSNITQPTEELIYSFAAKYALEYGNSLKTTITITDNGKTEEIILPNIPFEGITQKTDDLFDNGGIVFNIKDSIALLTVQTFNEIPLKKVKYKSRLKAIFQKIKEEKLKHLIIDVRDNGGGDTESVEELISYIYNKEFVFYKDVYQLHKKWDISIIPEISEYPKNISSWTLKKGTDGYYRAMIGVDGKKKVKPSKNNYSGKLYILINGSTLSAAAEFTSFIKQYRQAVFIGDEAGGNKTQNTSGYDLKIGLPNSKIIVAIPIILWKMNVAFENDGHGIKPDYFIKNSIQEEINNEDRVLNFTYEFIKKSKPEKQ